MKILIEGEKYPLDLLKTIFDDSKFYIQDLDYGIIIYVGYYHSFEKNEIIYMLPKVFMSTNEKTIFGVSKEFLLDLHSDFAAKHDIEYQWIRQITIYFYNSLLEFKRRNSATKLLQKSFIPILNTNIAEHEYSYLDLLLTFINFYQKNKRIIVFKTVEHEAKAIKKTKWNKTIQKSMPMINNNNEPFYFQFKNNKTIINEEEELLVIFFSILNHFKTEHHLNIHIQNSYKLLSKNQFILLQQYGLTKLKRIKFKYFNDTLKQIYNLCILYFSKTNFCSINKKKEEFISINNYNLVFEDMIDKLFSDPIIEKYSESNISLKNLKYNDDGKILDHIFDYNSLLDTSNIFYIGDSKYYKPTNIAGKISEFKQFTYAKNIIQYNINMLNMGEEYSKNIRYRDELTEGYNITPNFFIYGYIQNYKDFDNSHIASKGEVKKSFHFEKRLFDRDTLFIHQYEINFLYVLKAYTQLDSNKINSFRTEIKDLFRTNFINYFAKNEISMFRFYKYKHDNLIDFVELNFKKLLGKCFKTLSNELILAKHNSDGSLNELLDDFEEFSLS